MKSAVFFIMVPLLYKRCHMPKFFVLVGDLLKAYFVFVCIMLVSLSTTFGLQRVARWTSPKPSPTVTYILNSKGEKVLLSESLGYPESTWSGGKVITVPGSDGPHHIYIDADIYVCPSDQPEAM